jgi:hypothetical protein
MMRLSLEKFNSSLRENQLFRSWLMLAVVEPVHLYKQITMIQRSRNRVVRVTSARTGMLDLSIPFFSFVCWSRWL